VHGIESMADWGYRAMSIANIKRVVCSVSVLWNVGEFIRASLILSYAIYRFRLNQRNEMEGKCKIYGVVIEQRLVQTIKKNRQL